MPRQAQKLSNVL